MGIRGAGHTKCELKIYMTAEKAENINTSQAKQLSQRQHRLSSAPALPCLSPLSALFLLSLSLLSANPITNYMHKKTIGSFIARRLLCEKCKMIYDYVDKMA